ncbi:hypothetical protein KDAU_15820 [Dictyobacter aurantiacus]|uniref:DUF4177 domain-containing protein n=1 Tax=Dictyobacter aurantiacus TaxID=1936993 RepID=A0A401ZBS7_9CHLR|nr:hypothetical protein KDAU_15820 [Dictyobacter aurantiacus]
MQQWEYCSFLLHSGYQTQRMWKVIQMNEQNILDDGKVYASIVDFCNVLGAQGWELVGTQQPDPPRYLTLYFKRLRIYA